MKRFLIPPLAVIALAFVGCSTPAPDTSKPAIQQLQQQVQQLQASLSAIQQQEQADAAAIKQLQAELEKHRREPCPHWDPQQIDQLADIDSSFRARIEAADDNSTIGGKVSPDGSEEIQLDMPGLEHMKNKGGSDGAGLCVFTSIEMAAHWMNVEDLRGFQEKMTHEKGGGWPEKVDEMMKKYAPNVDYVQYSGTDPSIIKLALKTGRMCGVTYGYSPRYKSKISHMVDCVHMTDKWAAILDNNFPGEDQYEWMSPDEFLKRWKNDGGGWAIVLLSGNPPPPIPINNGERRSVSSPCAPGGPCRCCRDCSCGGNCNCRKDDKPCCKRCRCPLPDDAYPYTPRPYYPFYPPLWWRLAHPYWPYYPYSPYYPYREQNTEAWPLIRRVPHPFHPRPQGPRPIGPFPRPKCESLVTSHSPLVTNSDDDADWTFLWQWLVKIQIWKKPAVQDFGVTQDQMPKDAEERPFYSHKGEQITALEAFDLISKGGNLIDDTQKKRLTIIAAKDVADRIKSDLATSPELLPFKDKLLVTSYQPGHWAVTGVGLDRTEVFDFLWFRKRMPSPITPLVPKVPATIILQGAPDARGRGRVLHMQLDYNDGPAGLAKAIRKADPSYDPRKDQDMRKDSCPCPDDPDAPPQSGCTVYWTLGSVILLVLRFLIPDIYYGVRWVGAKAVSSIKSHASSELAALKAELAALKQKPAG